MKIIKTKFKNLLIVKQKNNTDNRGNLRETFNDKFLSKKFIFEYCTTSKKNVLRGFHFQTRLKQSKFVNVLKGKILDVVVDLRKNSKRFGKHYCIRMSDTNGVSIYIPPGFAHGFLGLKKENIISYHCTNYRSKKNEIGIIWNDNNLKIKWPIKKPILSKKDQKNISLKEFLKKNA